jgi:inosine-uridine nucleoside N-ribohydrolase
MKVVMMSATMHEKRELIVEGIIACGGQQAHNRAALTYTALCILGLQESIPVLQGSAQIAYKPQEHEYNLEGFGHAMAREYPAAQTFFLKLLQQLPEKSLVVQLQAGFTDVAQMINEHPALFLSKVCSLSIMGGLQQTHEGEGHGWECDDSQVSRETCSYSEFQHSAHTFFHRTTCLILMQRAQCMISVSPTAYR